MPKTNSSIRAAVLTQYLRVTDTHTKTQAHLRALA